MDDEIINEEEPEIIDDSKYMPDPTGGNKWGPGPFTPLGGPTPKTKEETQEKEELTFEQKLAIWTNNFTTPPVDLNVLKARGQRAIPGFANTAEFELFQKILKRFPEVFNKTGNIEEAIKSIMEEKEEEIEEER